MKRGTGLLLGLAVTAAAQVNIGLSPALAIGATAPPALAALQGRNSISGNVFGQSRQPLADVHVELLDDVGMTVSRTRTNGAGRYVFNGLPSNRYQVRVLPYGTDYIEQTQGVTLVPVSALAGSGTDHQQVDFYLRLRERARTGPFYAPGTVFAQEVPDAARRLYEKGIGELGDKREKEGLESLRRSLEVFPDYFLALDRLGTEYAVRGNQDKSYYEAAHILLKKAVEINPNSFSSLFGLGLSQYHLGMFEQSVESLSRAVRTYNKASDGHLWLGIALRRVGKLDQAESSLKRATELSKGKQANAHWHLAQIYNEQNRYEEAAAELELFLKRQPEARDAEKIRQLIAGLKEKAAKGSP